MNKKRPQRFFRRIAYFQIFLIFISLVTSSFVTRIAFQKSLETDHASNSFEQMIIFTLVPIFILLALSSIRFTYHLTKPLRGLVQKLQHLKQMGFHKKTPANSSGDELMDLEDSFNQVEQGLREYIHDLHLENEKNSILIHSISDGILAVDLQDNVILMNDNFCHNFLPFYINRIENMEDRSIWDILSNIQVENSFNAVLTDQSKKIFSNIKIVKNNRQKGFYNLSVSPIKGVGKKTEGAIGIFHDMSEQRLTERMRADFVTNVGHEVRTPLTAIMGYVQILTSQTGEMKPALQNYLQHIEQNCKRLTALFNDILHLSVIDSKANIDLVEIQVEDLVSHVLANVNQSYPNKKIQFEYQIQTTTFLGDHMMIEQLLTNLVDNAYKYNHHEGRIRIIWKDDHDGSILIVEDNGIGIPKKHWLRLFERFYRVDPSRSREMGGTGLGLAIVKHIVLKHNGKIEVSESELGGSQFRVSFPYDRTHFQRSNAAQEKTMRSVNMPTANAGAGSKPEKQDV